VLLCLDDSRRLSVDDEFVLTSIECRKEKVLKLLHENSSMAYKVKARVLYAVCCMVSAFRRSPWASDATGYKLSVRSVEE
jgi:hypothetical protein